MGTSWVAVVVWRMSTGTLDHAMLMLFFAGAALAVAAAIGYWLVSDDWRSPLGSGWHIPTNLNGWAPRTSAQLGAVEAIADRHYGVTLVRDVGAATIDVCAEVGGSLDHYIVEDDGLTMKQSEQTPTSLAWPRNWLLRQPLPLVFRAVSRRSALGGLWVAVGLVIAFGAAAWVLLQSPMARLKRGSDGTSWIEIRTQEDDDNGD